MAATLEDLTIEDAGGMGPEVKELSKASLSKGGAWATMIFRYQEKDEKTGEFGPVKYTVRRYQKRAGEYKQRSKFNISNVAQAQKVVEVLNGWLEEDAAE